MPAVEIEKLNTQVRLVAEKFGTPQEFIVALRSLFESYADLTYRLATMRRPSVILPEYHLSPVILRLLEKELGKYCEENPLSSLDVIDLLWKEPRREPRLLASALLGKIPLSHSEKVIERMLRWSAMTEEYTLAETLVASGSSKLRTEASEQWLEIIQTWLNSRSTVENSLGLNSLIPLIQDRGFVNLPQVFTLFTPYLKKVDPKLMSMLQSVIENLARRSPYETVFVLKQVLSGSQDPNLYRLLRRCLGVLPEESRLSLRDALAKNPPA